MSRVSTNFEQPPTAVALVLLLPIGEQIPIEGVMQVGSATENDIVLTDDSISRRHCVFEVGEDGRTTLRDLRSTNGTWVNGVRVTSAELQPGARIALGATRLRVVAVAGVEQSPIIGTSEDIERVRASIRAVAPSDATVLIIGETGVGKDLVAQAIHKQSNRIGAYVPVNCANFTPALVESILFGHEKGSFTGATSRQQGVFEQAHRGTLFLDELGELDVALQSRLLRVLETGMVRAIGATKEITVDVRVVAATNVDLPVAIERGRFREDLYYRLHQHLIRVPPLRERTSDVIALARHFLAEVDPTAKFSPAALERMAEHRWPGNVRELRNCVTRAALISQATIDAYDVVFDTLLRPPSRTPGVTGVQVEGRTLEEIERDAIQRALAANSGSIPRAAAALGIPKSTLYSWVRRLGLDKK